MSHDDEVVLTNPTVSWKTGWGTGTSGLAVTSGTNLSITTGTTSSFFPSSWNVSTISWSEVSQTRKMTKKETRDFVHDFLKRQGYDVSGLPRRRVKAPAP